MNWVWRKHTQAQPMKRILPLITYTLTTLCAFTLAGLFSSQVSTSMGNEVLLSGTNCGIPIMSSNSTKDIWAYFLPYEVQRLVFSADYAQACYGNNADNKDCSTFLQKNLPWTSKHDIDCPFPGYDKICRSNSTNLRLDTGYINSNFHLGINSPSEDRFLYRNIVECAPLNTEGYSENVTEYAIRNKTNPRQVMRYYYGNQFDNHPMTYEYPADPPVEQNYRTNSRMVNSDYSLQ